MTEAKTNRNATPSEDTILGLVPQMKRGREARVGLFVIFGIVAFMVVLFQLTDPATLRGRYMVYTIVDDAGGVRRGDPIQMRGVNIGQISDFVMNPATNLVTIELEVEGEWHVPLGSTTRLGASGMFGGRTMEILASNEVQSHVQGDTLPGQGGNAGGLLGSMDELGDQAGTVMSRIEMLLDTSTIASVQGTARELEGLLSQLSDLTAAQAGSIEKLLGSLNRSAEGLEGAAAAGPDIARVVARADSAMATLAETSANLDGAIVTLRSILDRMDRGEGTLGKLMTDQALYDNMNAAAESLASLMTDLQANPKRYINLSIF